GENELLREWHAAVEPTASAARRLDARVFLESQVLWIRDEIRVHPNLTEVLADEFHVKGVSVRNDPHLRAIATEGDGLLDLGIGDALAQPRVPAAQLDSSLAVVPLGELVPAPEVDREAAVFQP